MADKYAATFHPNVWPCENCEREWGNQHSADTCCAEEDERGR